jgi:hypothetical protein
MKQTTVVFSATCEDIKDGALCKLSVSEDGKKAQCDLRFTESPNINATLTCSGDNSLLQKVFTSK